MSIYPYYWREAKEAERAMQWAKAAQYHELGGRPKDAAVCRELQAVMDRGDKWRARVKELEAAGLSFEHATREANREIYGSGHV